MVRDDQSALVLARQRRYLLDDRAVHFDVCRRQMAQRHFEQRQAQFIRLLPFPALGRQANRHHHRQTARFDGLRVLEPDRFRVGRVRLIGPDQVDAHFHNIAIALGAGRQPGQRARLRNHADNARRVPERKLTRLSLRLTHAQHVTLLWPGGEAIPCSGESFSLASAGKGSTVSCDCPRSQHIHE